MALNTNSIAEHTFLSLIGPWAPPREMILRDQRHGIDGTEFTHIGRKGQIYSQRSIVDQASFADAVAKLEDYLALIIRSPVECVWAGQSSTAAGFRVKVLDVQPVRIGPATGFTGGLNPPSLGVISCRWILEAVPV